MEYPSVSVILPVRNEGRYIRAVLDAILRQDYPGEKMEILVVDGMSTDGTRELVRAYSSELSGSGTGRPSVKLLDNPNRIVPSAMNCGIRAARGEVIVRIDGHTVVEPTYVSGSIEGLIRTGADCVGGVIESVGSSYVSRGIATAMSSPFGVGGSAFRIVSHGSAPRDVDTVPFGTFRREVFDRVGLFNEHLVCHEDYELNYRIRAAGGRLTLLPCIKSVYYVRSGVAPFIRQYWQYGLWKGRFLRTHPRSLRLRHCVPPLFVLGLAFSSLLALWPSVGALPLLGLVLAYCAFLALASADAAWRGRGPYAPLLWLFLPILHLSWGTGVLYGLALPRVGAPPRDLAPASQESTQPQGGRPA
jgi:glycosyltransferase involved in cell wall biosynthesis